MDNIFTNLKENKKIIFICILIIVIILIIIYFINREKINSDSNFYIEENIEKYNANQFVPIYVTESDIAKKYLNDFKNLILYNKKEAYELLNYSYKNKRFESYEKFETFINDRITQSTYSMEIDKYNVNIINNKKVYNIFDKSGYQYIFKENSIMNYEVYLDEYTVEIK